MRPKGQLFDLKRFRAERNLTQIEMSEALDVPQSFVSSIENGKRCASKSFLDKLSDHYKVDNISDYLSNPISSSPQIMKNIRNSIVNSPGGINLTHGIANKLSKSELVELVTKSKTSEDFASPTLSSDATLTFLNLLVSAEERYLRERERADQLKEEVIRLKNELKQYKNKKQNVCTNECT